VSTMPQQKWVPAHIPGGKGGRCVGLSTLPPSCADCLEILEPQSPGTVRAWPGLYRDSCVLHWSVSSITEVRQEPEETYSCENLPSINLTRLGLN